MKRMLMALAGAASLLAVTGQAMAQPVVGGDLVIGQQASPDFLDAMVTTAQGSRNVNLHIYEMLISRDENVNPVPDLARSFTESEDGLTYVFHLREGVRFHNGKEMTSEDVKASLERYARLGTDRVGLEKVVSIEADDPLTVTVTLSERVPSFIEQISSPRAPLVIIPAEERDAERGETELVGTGPYELVEWVGDSHITLRRFEDYLPNPDQTGTNGLAGHKVAYFDTVTFRIIPETGARVSALETGEIHISEDIPNQAAVRLANSDTVEIVDLLPWGMLGALFNVNHPPTDNLDVRRAIQIGIDAEEIIAIANDGVYRLGHGWNYPESDYWAGDIGLDRYNQGNLEEARRILSESGYAGEPLVLLTNSQIRDVNMASIVLAEQLGNIGFNVQLDVFDFPTMSARRNEPDAWNVTPNFWGLAPWLGPYGLPAFWTGEGNQIHYRDAELEAVADDLRLSPQLEDRVAAAAEFQRQLYDKVYWLKFGDTGIQQGVRREIEGFTPFRIPRAWNIWFEQ